jgi:L-cysteine S-thiosulfotransferase
MAWRFPLFATAAVMVFVASAVAEAIRPQDKKSGFDFVAPATQAMQRDDLSNPGMLFIAEGERLWHARDNPAGAACAGCHGEARQSMRGTAIRYPKTGKRSSELVDLQGQINFCRQERQKAPAHAYESPELIALTSYVAHQSRGMTITLPQDRELEPHRKNGKLMFERRLGQLGLSCAACHDARWGQRLGGSTIPQAHPNAYPLYRLEWQTLGSLGRRLRNCMIGMRAEPFPYGAKEMLELELYLMSRASGLPIETPGVRP